METASSASSSSSANRYGSNSFSLSQASYQALVNGVTCNPPLCLPHPRPHRRSSAPRFFLHLPQQPISLPIKNLQSVAIFFFWALAILIILRENLGPLLVSESFIFVFAGVAFLVEFSVIGKGITGLGGDLYHISGGLTLLCACSCLFLSMKPSAFFAEFLLSSGLTFKGTWLFQIGLSLYTDAFALKGCRAMLVLPATGDAFVQCDLEEDGLRGIALMNLIFIGHVVLVLILGLGLIGLLSSNRNFRIGQGSGPLLAELGQETVDSLSS
ncbi:uncharacterized protein LOC111498877 [Cucurbita maxima]|uniref:Uncharacterized protein LOC111498877 n=1 Tax=Cucurbita maxima TaxID=3661 RepID=A0A6J1L0X4_CUCMA|nr:uncharacterized protein LOC111498877 [Cucurbita maxima]